MKAKMNRNQEKMEAAIRSGQGEIRAAISSIWAELEESMKHGAKNVLMSLDHRT
jgi:hypothetical protein